MTLPTQGCLPIWWNGWWKVSCCLCWWINWACDHAFCSTYFVKLLHSRPGLEIAAFVIVGWVGVKLAVLTLGHEAIGWIPHDFAHSTEWKLIFYAVLILIAVVGWFFTGGKKKPGNQSVDTL